MTPRSFATHAARSLWALALALSAPVAQATAEWQINTEGTGIGGAQVVSALATGGSGFIQVLPDAGNPTAFSFQEHGAYQALGSDWTTPFGKNDVTVTYALAGSGSFLDPGNVHITSGTITLYADPVFDFGTTAANYGADNGTPWAVFSVVGNSISPAGLMKVEADIVAGSLLPGYLFGADGSDLASRSDLRLTVSIFNQTIISDSLATSEVACGMAGYTGPGCDGAPFANSPLAYTVRDQSFVTISAVPEPEMASMHLAGLGLIWLATRRRRPSRG